MSKENTAVEWLIKKVTNRQNGIFDGFPHLSLDEIYEKAKEMEKQQIIDAHIHGHNAPSSTLKNFDAEQYYNETYNTNHE